MNNDRVVLPANMIPSWRTNVAIKNGVERNLIFNTWGGLGDVICAEPTLRYALNTIKGVEISLASDNPEFFKHLEFKKVFDLNEQKPVWSQYLKFDTIVSPEHLTWEFFGHMITNCVDFPSMCALRCQLPIADRVVQLYPDKPNVIVETTDRDVWVHAGKHWPSKSFPKDWWDRVLELLIVGGARPVLIGADADDNRGTIDVSVSGCLDLRNKLSLNDSVHYLQQAKVVLTNDSSPLHMAVTGNAHLGFVASCKHPDFITHWRKNESGKAEWSWRMENLGVGGIWDVMDYCPNKENKVNVDNVEESMLRSWLPKPEVMANWALERLK